MASTKQYNPSEGICKEPFPFLVGTEFCVFYANLWFLILYNFPQSEGLSNSNYSSPLPVPSLWRGVCVGASSLRLATRASSLSARRTSRHAPRETY